jgi:hypothetical protein
MVSILTTEYPAVARLVQVVVKVILGGVVVGEVGRVVLDRLADELDGAVAKGELGTAWVQAAR